ncbi:hypothetical protein G3H63_10490 [Microbacterium resistens]|uniref:hypothetical protein n=1 Tax=Microbacterium resistens TaxID=156977 RepID=UPI001C55E75F|nr:hypothetical protein [Microbacterium resistens]MBW1639493.1 hypothetical protein [Microbacterium resistens]
MVASAAPEGDARGDAAGPGRPGGPGRLLLALMIACGVLLVTTLGLGVAVLALSGARADAGPPAPTASASASPTPSPAVSIPVPDLQEVQGFEIGVVSDLDIGDVVMAKAPTGEFSSIHAVIVNPAETATDAFFDVTSYDAEGGIVARFPATAYLLPGQRSLLTGILPRDLTEVSRILVEQTRGGEAEAVAAGTVELKDVRSAEDGRVQAQFVSTLDRPAPLADVYVVGFDGDDIFAVGQTVVDIPAGGEFGATLSMYLATKGDPAEFTEIPADAEYEAFFEMERPR